MCGILAVRGETQEAAVRAALSIMHHRGPDGSDLWMAPGIALGHTRLAVVGVANGRQPMANEDGSIHLVLNGELYDDGNLRHGLEQRGHRLRTQSDSEMALHLYEEHGLDFLHHLRGEFALLLWDQPRLRLIAARDRFGIKPLCYAERDGDLYFASEAKALFALGISARWDGLSFLHAATHQYLPPERTLFANVRQVRPGHCLVSSTEGLRSFSYWDLDYGGEPSAPDPEATLSLLDEAVRLRLRADVPVACCLSGGIDSSAVVALAARHSTPPPDCFTVAFDHPAYDESAAAAEVARHLGVPLHTVHVSQTDLLEHLSDAVYSSEGLAINGQLVGRFLLSRAIRDAGYKVVLSGEGADEVFMGYAHLERDFYLSTGDEAGLASLQAAHPLQSGVMLPGRDSPDRGGLPTFLATKLEIGRTLLDLMHEEYTQHDALSEMMAAFDRPGQLHGRHPVEQAAYLWTRLGLANYILKTLGDGAEMAHSVEGRPPFLDHVLFEHVRSLPVASKAVGKQALRDALRDVLPSHVRTRPKHPFLAPPLMLNASPALQDRIQDTLRSQALPFIDSRKLRRWLDDKTVADPVLTTLLSACALQDRFALGTDVW